MYDHSTLWEYPGLQTNPSCHSRQNYNLFNAFFLPPKELDPLPTAGLFTAFFSPDVPVLLASFVASTPCFVVFLVPVLVHVVPVTPIATFASAGPRGAGGGAGDLAVSFGVSGGKASLFSFSFSETGVGDGVVFEMVADGCSGWDVTTDGVGGDFRVAGREELDDEFVDGDLDDDGEEGVSNSTGRVFSGCVAS